MKYREVNFEELKGKILLKVEVNRDADYILFLCENEEVYRMLHEQNCCESVSIEDICGDVNSLIGEVLVAEKRTSDDYMKDHPQIFHDSDRLWTFYEIATIQGSVTIRWYGESNGYYSIEVDFQKLIEK